MHAADWLGMAVAAKLLHAPSPGATGLKAEVTTTLPLTLALPRYPYPYPYPYP